MDDTRIKSVADIQKAHDILHPIVHREIDCNLSEGDLLALAHGLRVLCWVLSHEEGESFQGVIDAVQLAVRRAGYELTYEPEEE